LRDLQQVNYLPILAISNAEMAALEYLPDAQKDAILPLFRLKRWGASHDLAKTEQRIQQAYGNRPYIGDVAPATPFNGSRQNVHNQLDALRDAANGYANWCQYASQHPAMIPTVQLGDLTQVAVQVQRLEALGRGLAVYIPPQMNAQTANIAGLLARHVQNQGELVFVVDLGAVNQTLLVAQARTTNLVNSALALMPTMSAAISASSFPSDFVGLTNQGIYERQHFNGIVPHVPGNVIYSDHGSARTEVQAGPKGRPAPRIDLPERLQWNFFRANGGQGAPTQNYQQQAAAAVAAHPHIPTGVWGFDRVRQTAAGAPNSISSPATSTSARINMHLFRQC
jgi:hypothetical protein